MRETESLPRCEPRRKGPTSLVGPFLGSSSEQANPIREPVGLPEPPLRS